MDGNPEVDHKNYRDQKRLVYFIVFVNMFK